MNTFLDSSSFNVTVLSREGSKSTFPSNVKVIRADYDNVDSLTSAFKGQDAVISLVGGGALGDQNKLIDAAIAAGAKHFIPSEFGSNTVNPRLLEIVPVFSAKKGTTDYLKSKEDKISWTSVITGPFFDWGLKIGFLGFDAASKTATLIDDGKGQFSSTTLRKIGLALIKILEKPSVAKNHYVYLSSFDTSQAELLTVIEKLSGEKWTIKNTTTEELLKIGNDKLAKQDFSGVGDLIKAGAFGKEGLGDSRPAGLWNEKLGLQQENLEETIKASLGSKFPFS